MHWYCSFSQIPFAFSSTHYTNTCCIGGTIVQSESVVTVIGKSAWDEKVQKEEIKDLEWAVGGEDGSVSLTALCVKMLS